MRRTRPGEAAADCDIVSTVMRGRADVVGDDRGDDLGGNIIDGDILCKLLRRAPDDRTDAALLGVSMLSAEASDTRRVGTSGLILPNNCPGGDRSIARSACATVSGSTVSTANTCATRCNGEAGVSVAEGRRFCAGMGTHT